VNVELPWLSHTEKKNFRIPVVCRCIFARREILFLLDGAGGPEQRLRLVKYEL
jgi:hypothetical protein